jgi:hypothetical protein
VPPVTEETPCFKNLYISNVVCQGAKRAIWFNGLPEMPLENLQMRNSIFVADKGCEMHYAKDILFENVIIENKSGDRVKYADVTNFVEK